MPTRRQIRDATPRCPGRKLSGGNWEDCDRLLRWRHDYGAWQCPTHGYIEDAAERAIEALSGA